MGFLDERKLFSVRHLILSRKFMVDEQEDVGYSSILRDLFGPREGAGDPAKRTFQNFSNCLTALILRGVLSEALFVASLRAVVSCHFGRRKMTVRGVAG